MIPEGKIAEIRERANIVEIISENVNLKRSGSNFKGVCPFHADSDPSFSVSPDRGFFHCFGCGLSGDVFSFLQNLDGIDFIESARVLAERYNVELPEEQMSDEERSIAVRAREVSQRRLYLIEEATKFFEVNLQGSALAKEMLKSRGIDLDTAERYRLGYAPDAWGGLIDHFKAMDIDPVELEGVGLVASKFGKGFYDRFRNRLMFTILNGAGKPIAFSGRAMKDGDVKYINSPETKEYTKGRVLFGLYQARVAISKTKEVVLVEGNFDVVSLAQAGIANVLAPLGTALTAEQVKLLRKRSESVAVMFDGDEAGRRSAIQAFPLLARAGLASYFVPVPDGEDPDSLAKEGKILDAMAGRVGLLDHIIDLAADHSDGSVQDLARRLEWLKKYLDCLRAPMERELYQMKIAESFSLDLGTVFKYLGGKAREVIVDSSKDVQLPGSAEERELVGVVLDCPEVLGSVLDDDSITISMTPSIMDVLNNIAKCMNDGVVILGDLVSMIEDASIMTWVTERAMEKVYDSESAPKAIKEIKDRVLRSGVLSCIVGIEERMKEASKTGDTVLFFKLSKKKVALQNLCRDKAEWE